MYLRQPKKFIFCNTCIYLRLHIHSIINIDIYCLFCIVFFICNAISLCMICWLMMLFFSVKIKVNKDVILSIYGFTEIHTNASDSHTLHLNTYEIHMHHLKNWVKTGLSAIITQIYIWQDFKCSKDGLHFFSCVDPSKTVFYWAAWITKYDMR